MGNDLLGTVLQRAADGSLDAADLARMLQGFDPRVDIERMSAVYDAWLTRNPKDKLRYAVLFNYGVSLTEAGQLDKAAELMSRAIEAKPGFVPPYINLGRLHERRGALDQALTSWNDALLKMGEITDSAILNKTTTLNQIARVLESRYQDAPAESMLRQSIDLDRNQPEALQHYLALRQRQCLWPVVQPWGRIGHAELMRAISPLSIGAYTDDPMLHLASGWNYNKRDVGTPQGPLPSHWAAQERRDHPKLRIGYLSSDLRNHAVGYLMAELFELHDRDAVEIFAYYCGPAGEDSLQNRIRPTVDHWVPVNGMNDVTAAQRIADDGIQILVDVNGYTKDGRTKLLARRPAPVIVNWLGFPGSMGSPYHHYIVADDWIIPKEHEIYYSEKVLRLPCYQPNDRKRTVADKAPTREEAGLPADAMVYCCFNGSHKISRFTFERWLTILGRVPGSVLWLLSSAPSTEQRLKEYAKARGISPDRLIFAPKMANPQHLARYPLADLFLDSAPYGAHTTASDALWMGVPMLTMSGRSFASRVCGSLVRAAGLPDLDCASPEEFVDRAVAMGRDPSIAHGYRGRLAASRDRSVLFDTPLLVKSLEKLYREMWEDLRAGRLPVPDLANLETYLEVGCAVDHEAEEVQAIKDYKGWWREKLAAYDALRPIPTDKRLWKKRR